MLDIKLIEYFKSLNYISNKTGDFWRKSFSYYGFYKNDYDKIIHEINIIFSFGSFGQYYTLLTINPINKFELSTKQYFNLSDLTTDEIINKINYNEELYKKFLVSLDIERLKREFG